MIWISIYRTILHCNCGVKSVRGVLSPGLKCRIKFVALLMSNLATMLTRGLSTWNITDHYKSSYRPLSLIYSMMTKVLLWQGFWLTLPSIFTSKYSVHLATLWQSRKNDCLLMTNLHFNIWYILACSKGLYSWASYDLFFLVCAS